jgi:hypothetical protein
MQRFQTWIAGVLCLALGACAGLSPNDSVRRNAAHFLPSIGADPLMSPAPHNITHGNRAAGNPVRRGEFSERFELRDGDCGGTDCGNPRARAELQLKKDAHRARVGKDTWYGYSFHNVSVPSFTKQNSLRLVFGQWTFGGTSKPIFRFIQLGRGEADFANCDPAICATSGRGDLAVQLSNIAADRNWGARQNKGYVCRLFDMQASQGRWMDILVNTNFSAGSDGYLRIWVNDDLVCNYTGPLVSTQSLTTGSQIKHRRGIFASWTKRWQAAEGARAKPQLVVYYDEFRVGKTRANVDVRHLAIAGKRPVN